MGFQVESFHINVGAGDGAIHLLTVDGPQGQKRIIVQAFLVDGGKTTAVDKIDLLIAQIERDYSMPGNPNPNTLKFDGFIITHWDGDHYGGLEQWLLDGIKEDINRPVGFTCYNPRAYYYADKTPKSITYSPCAWPAKSKFCLNDDGNLCVRNAAYNITRVRTGWENMLGRNLFRQYTEHPGTNGRFATNPVAVNSLDVLLGNNPIELPDGSLGFNLPDYPKPALYCVAAEQHVLGSAKIHVTDTNASSFIFIVVWQTAPYAHRVSHYFAGDSHSELELQVAKWMDPAYNQVHDPPQAKPPRRYPITSMKLSHHGASTSNPYENFDQFNVTNIVFSAGEQYGHPRWEVLTNISNWFTLKQASENRVIFKAPFLPCRYPYWLVINPDGSDVATRMGMNELFAEDMPETMFQKLKKIKKMAKAVVNIVNKRRILAQNQLAIRDVFDGAFPRNQTTGKKRPVVIKKNFLEISRKLMAKVSAYDDSDVNVALAAVGNNMPASIQTPEILCVQIISAPQADQDGQVMIRGTNGNAIRVPREPTVNPAQLPAPGGNALRASDATLGQNFPMNCSVALITAKMGRARLVEGGDDDDDENSFKGVDTYPYRGFDQPRMIDLTDGVPDWDQIRKSDSFDSTDTDGVKSVDALEEDDEDDDWDDIGDSLSVRSVSSSSSVSTSTAVLTPMPLVCFQEMPPDIRALVAKVYLTCPDETNPKSPVKLPEGSQACILSLEHPHSGFLNTLHLQAIGLAQVPDGTKSTPIDIDDEVYQWLGLFSGWEPENRPVPTGFALGLRKVSEWPLKDLKTTRLDFEMTVPFLSGPHLQFSTDEGARLTFSKVDETDADAGSAADGGQLKRGVTAKALDDLLLNRRSLVFGLESLKEFTTTLKDLATFMRVDVFNSPLLSFLGGGLVLTLNTSKDFHNAVWFRPSMDYETIMRLQFHVDTTRFNEWLQTLSPNLKVETLQVIGRKKATWVWMVPEDKMAFTSSLTFLCRIAISPSLSLEGIFKYSQDSVSLILSLNEAAVKRNAMSVQAMAGSRGILDDIMNWLSTVFGVSSKSELDEVLKKATNDETGVMSDSSIIPRRIQIELDVKPDGGIKGVRGVSIDIEACLTIGRSAIAVATEMPAVFLFTFGWSKALGFHLKGKLWSVIPDTPFAGYDRALPEFEEHEYLKPMSPVDPSNQLRTIDVARLLSAKTGEVKNLPAGIPNEIYLCEVSLTQGKVSFTGALRCSKPLAGNPNKPTPPMPPTISLENVELEASYTWATKSPSEDGFKMSLAIAVDLNLAGQVDETDDDEVSGATAAKLTGLVKYNRGDWSIVASVYNLSIRHLLQFWDVDDRGPISDLLGKVNIDHVTVTYEFNNGKTKAGAMVEDGKDMRSPSLLKIDGQFTLAKVATLTFEYINEGGDGWAFKAGLGGSDQTKDTATVGGLLSGFLDDEIVLALPDAVSQAAIKDAEGEEALRLVIAKNNGTSVFALLVKIGKVSVWFIQLRQGAKGTVKRILKAAISKVSVDVSAFQTTINSPWEDFFFLWVQDQTVPQKGVDALTGITQKEFEDMSAVLKERLEVPDEQLLLFKPAAQKNPDPTSQVVRRIAAAGGEGGNDGGQDEAAKKVVIAAGSHLVIVAKKSDGKPSVILDHLFGAKKNSASGKAYDDALVPYEATKGQAPDASGAEKGVKAPYKVKIGPLSVGNIGLWFKNGMIGITLDANLIMGPLGFSLLGFTIGVPFSGGKSLANPPELTDIEWGLQGLILAMDKPPLTIAGGFMRDTSNPDVQVMYTGGLIVGFKPWSFEAMGAYATVEKKKTKSGDWITTIDTKSLSQFGLFSSGEGFERAHSADVIKVTEEKDTFTFSFIYVKMNGPLFSVGFADVAGLVGGFGINSDITLPTVEQVTEFPFVAERGDAGNSSPVERMQNLMSGSWFRPAEGLYWAAAGARVTAFQMLAANIVLVLQFGNGNLLFGIFGVATCDVPALEAPVKFAHVELGIVCTFDVNSGVFKFEAQLSPRSFVLAPQCHLTGGIALFAWSKGDYSDANNLVSAGDWVLTIGGYHRAFRPPKQYPKPPRLGISWSLSSCLSVKGEAYFAITPKVCMGGGKIRAALSLGTLYAWFDAFMDFLMNFEPFFFQMTARVSVGVRYTLDLWLVTIRISVEIAAGLDLTGPPFGGVVHVDFWVFGFDIKFGESPNPPSAIGLDRFFQVATKTGSSGASSQGLLTGQDNGKAQPQPDTAAILLTCETGLLPPLQDMEAKSVDAEKEDPQNSKWYVKSGKFSLMASFQIPVTTAKLVETRTQKTSTGQDQDQSKESECQIEQRFKNVYAKPMQLRDPLTSAVAISVRAPKPRESNPQEIHALDEWENQKWKLTTQVKAVQSSIWGQYDKNLDPSLRKGPIEGLLHGEGATMQLVTGISIVPPDPAMAADKVNKFNITEDHKSSVYDPWRGYWPLFINVTEKQDDAWSPKERGNSWEGFANQWASIGDAKTSKAVDIWAKRMRYDTKSVEGDQKDEKLKGKFKPLRGVAPKKLFKMFEHLVPALPLVAVGYPPV